MTKIEARNILRKNLNHQTVTLDAYHAAIKVAIQTLDAEIYKEAFIWAYGSGPNTLSGNEDL